MTDPHRLIAAATPLLWTNPQLVNGKRRPLPQYFDGQAIGSASIKGAQERFNRFAPLLAELFPELSACAGLIESDLMPLPAMQQALGMPQEKGKLWLKADHNLAIAGSIKARGGFHEVLEFTERLALQHGLINSGADYRTLRHATARQLFSQYQIAVGSTGNLGMSIGVMSSALGFRSVVHMSSEAKEWKKERLRRNGVEVVEHAGDYEKAVSQGRQLAKSEPLCHFVDDESSTSLFLGYSASALYLQRQLVEKSIVVDATHPLLVYVPCGVGGAPAGIAWGLHHVFGQHVHCYFAEPVQSPCFLIQMLADEGTHPCVYDYGLTNCTEADGLAVPRASVLAAKAMHDVVAGVYTVEDSTLLQHLKWLYSTENMRIEPSAAAGFSGPAWLSEDALSCAGATHLVWTTGGSLVPDCEYEKYLELA